RAKIAPAPSSTSPRGAAPVAAPAAAPRKASRARVSSGKEPPPQPSPACGGGSSAVRGRKTLPRKRGREGWGLARSVPEPGGKRHRQSRADRAVKERQRRHRDGLG